MLFLYILKKRIKLIIAITFLSISFAILYVFFVAHPVYVTSAKLLPTGEDNSLSNILIEKNQDRTTALSQVSDTKESMERMNIDLDQRKNVWVKEKKSLVKEKSEIGKKFNTKLKDRNQFIDKIPEDIFKDYNRLFKANNGIAIVTVKRDICQGCLVKLPVGDIDKMKNSTLPVLCSSGKHFLTE